MAGTAIVVWNVAFYTYLGGEYNILLYSLRLILGGLAIGILFWWAILTCPLLTSTSHEPILTVNAHLHL